MHCVRKITDDLYWVGCNDRKLARFENIHPIPEGTSYNSYLLLDEKTVLFDTTEWEVSRQFMENVEHVLDGRKLDYIIVNHMEPDHGASLAYIVSKYPDAEIVCTPKAADMLKQFNYADHNVKTVKEAETLSFGKHEVAFYTAPMVHWPEVMVTYDKTSKVLFSADAFGSFGALNGRLFADEVDYKKNFEEYARRYYTNIVGKYGPQVQRLLQKAAALDIEYICPLHGLTFRTKEDIEYIVDKYNKWSTYTPEEKGALICYASMYGGTEEAAELLGAKLCELGMTNFELYDVSSTHVSTLISSAFKFSHIALFSVTYNLKVFPVMQGFLDDMAALNLQNRTVSIVENGSWSPQAAKFMTAHFEKMKNMTTLGEVRSIASTMTDENYKEIEQLAHDIVDSLK